jgi:hypothetical protein
MGELPALRVVPKPSELATAVLWMGGPTAPRPTAEPKQCVYEGGGDP